MRSTCLIALVLAVVLGLLAFGCSKKTTAPQEPVVDDNTAIATVLNASSFTTMDNYGDDGSAGFAKDAKSDSFPAYVRWRRRITSITRSQSIVYDSNNTFATVTISTSCIGRFVVDNTNNGVIDTFSRDLNDHGVRHVWLKKWNNRWHIWGASPMVIATAVAATGVVIDSIIIHGTSGDRPDVTFLGTSYGTALRREQMPIFAPGATVTATVYTRTSSGGDSTWAFLHRRIRPYGELPNHLREPLLRESQFVFTRTWTLASDSILVFPAVRHACLDVILGSTLFGNSSSEYSALLWTMPYIVKGVNDSLPE